MIRELLPYLFYIAGSVCFLIGSVITVVEKLKP